MNIKSRKPSFNYKKNPERKEESKIYECLFCDKRCRIIYDGRCWDCELEFRRNKPFP